MNTLYMELHDYVLVVLAYDINLVHLRIWMSDSVLGAVQDMKET